MIRYLLVNVKAPNFYTLTNGRATRDWSLPDTVYLNPEKVHEQSEKADRQMAVS